MPFCSKDGLYILHFENEGRPVPGISTVQNLSNEQYKDFMDFWNRENYSETWYSGYIKIEWRKND